MGVMQLAMMDNPDTPTLTILVYPAWDERSTTPYLALMEEYSSVAQVLLRIPKKTFAFASPTHWHGGDTFPGHPKWDVNFIIVANEKGMEEYFT
jgi:hypothetical protein